MCWPAKPTRASCWSTPASAGGRRRSHRTRRPVREPDGRPVPGVGDGGPPAREAGPESRGRDPHRRNPSRLRPHRRRRRLPERHPAHHRRGTGGVGRTFVVPGEGPVPSRPAHPPTHAAHLLGAGRIRARVLRHLPDRRCRRPHRARPDARPHPRSRGGGRRHRREAGCYTRATRSTTAAPSPPPDRCRREPRVAPCG